MRYTSYRENCFSGTDYFSSYSEAIESLYSANTFCLESRACDFLAINHLPSFMLPQRLIMIRTLYFRLEIDHQYFRTLFSMPADFDPSNQIWHSLSQMTGLRTLHITLVLRGWYHEGYHHDGWPRISEGFCEPVKKLTAPTKFVIVLPNMGCSTDIDVGDSKCVFELPEAAEASVSSSSEDE